MNRIDRLMATILLLQSRRVITADQIAAHFEISLRTVYRDIAALSEGGVPVAAEAGVGYSLMGGYMIPPVMFTPAEAGALFLAGELVNQLTDRSLQEEMRSALLKIRAVLPRGQQDHWERLGRGTALLVSSRSPSTQAHPVLSHIQSALAQRRTVRLRYRTKGEDPPRDREVEPMGLLFYAGHWHLIGYCRWRQEYRDFRTDRIADLKVGATEFVPRPGFSLQTHIQAWCREFETEEMVFRLAPTALDRFVRYWPGEEVIRAPQGERLEIRVRGTRGEWLTGWLLSFGDALEVQSPSALRAELSALAARVARRHMPTHEAHDISS